MITFGAARVARAIGRDGEGCRCACALCGLHLPCEAHDPLDDEPLCCCHGAPWLAEVPGGPCTEPPS